MPGGMQGGEAGRPRGEEAVVVALCSWLGRAVIAGWTPVVEEATGHGGQPCPALPGGCRF